MVFKKYIYRNGKKYGPYLYENKRVGNKIITTYVGQAKQSVTLLKSFWFAILSVLIIGFAIFLINNIQLTGKIVSVFDEANSPPIEEDKSVDYSSSQTLSEPASEEQISSSNSGSGGIEVGTTETTPISKEITEETSPLENVTEDVSDFETIENIPENTTEEMMVSETNIIKNITLPELNITLNETILNETFVNETIIEQNLTNFTLIEENLTANLTNIIVKTSNSRIKLGEPVKWTKNVSLEEPIDVVIKIPSEAENITIKKIEKDKEEIVETLKSPITGSLISGMVSAEIDLNKEPKFILWIKKVFEKIVKGITGRAISEIYDEIAKESDLVLDANATEYSIEYYTSAPIAQEIEISDSKKEITISGPETIHYNDILAYTNLPKEVLNNNSIKIYWIINNSKESVNFSAFDSDENGLFDYIEWNVPSLSSQTYEISIIILNPYTYLRDRETWIVAFNTTGEADLIINSTNAYWEEILSDNSETFDEMRFLNLKCGENSLKNELKIIDFDGVEHNYNEISESDSIKPSKFLINNYSCENSIGYFSNYMKKAGYAVLEFNFGEETAYAYDPTATTVYNFTDTTNNKAQATSTGDDTPGVLSSFCGPEACTGYNSTHYTNVANNDASRNAWNGNMGYGTWANILYNFTINEAVADITQIDLKWIGYDQLTYGDEFDLWIWNFTSGAWVQWAQDAVVRSSDQTYNKTYTSGFANFINSTSKKLHIAASGDWNPLTVCVDKDSLIDTPDGLRKINELKVGDKIYSYNGSEKEFDSITAVYYHDEENMYEISFSDSSINATLQHKFYVLDKGYVMAKDLNVGDILLESELSYTPITKIEKIRTNTTVYDITAGKNRNYFANGILVQSENVEKVNHHTLYENYVEVKVTYSYTTLGVNITTNATSATTTTQNATYLITIGNNGSATNTYNLSVTNTNSADTASLNQSNITLVASASGSVLLKVGDTTAGNYNVTVMAIMNTNATVNATTSIISTTVSAADTCTYSSGIWNLACSDYCNLTTSTDMLFNLLNITGTGALNVNARIFNYSSITIYDQCNVTINHTAGGKLG